MSVVPQIRAFDTLTPTNETFKRLTIHEGSVIEGKTSFYLILYERPSNVEDTQALLTRHGIGVVECELDDIYEFYNAVNADSRTLFICRSSKDLYSPKVLCCSNVHKFELIEPSNGEKTILCIEDVKRKFEFTFNDSVEASHWIEAYLKPSTTDLDSKSNKRFQTSFKFKDKSDESEMDSLLEVRPDIKRQCLRLIRRLLRSWLFWKRLIRNRPRKIHLNSPFPAKSKNNFVFTHRLPMLLHWNHHIIMLTERNDLWCLDFTSESEPLWNRSWPKIPPTVLSCITISSDTIYALGINGNIYSISLGLREKNLSEWKEVKVSPEIPKNLQKIHDQNGTVYGITEDGAVWKFTLDNPYGSLSAQEFPNSKFSGIVSNYNSSEIGKDDILVYDSNSNVFSLDFTAQKSKRVLRGNVRMGQLTQLMLSCTERPMIFNIQESEKGTTQIHLNHLSMLRWNTLDLSLDHLLTHTILIPTQQGCKLIGVDSFNTIYTKSIHDLYESKPWVENWILPMPEKASYWNSDIGWEKIPVPLSGGFRDLSVSGDGSVWGLTQDMSVWSLGVEGGGWWKPINGQFTCISVGMKNNVWAVDIEGDVYCQLRDNIWIKDGESLGFRCVNVGSDGVIWGLDRAGYLWRRMESGWKRLTGDEFYDNFTGSQERKLSWKNIQGKLQTISVGNVENVWATTIYNQVYQHTFQSGWKLIPKIKLKSVTVGSDGIVWGIDPFMDIYRYAGDNKFVLENGKLKSVHTGNSNNVWGLGCDGSIWRRLLNVPDVCYDKDFSKNALLCANLSCIVYDPTEKIEERLSNMNLKLKKYLIGGVGVEDSFGFIACNSNSITIVFRGTRSWKDIFADVDMSTTDFYAEISYSNIRVHRGFARYYNALKDQIFRMIDTLIAELGGPEKVENVYLTGHSLGGAMAILCSVDLTNYLVKRYGPQPANFLQCLTYGAPPVGDVEFRQYWITLQTVMRGYHFQDPSDDVCHGDMSVMHRLPINLFTLGFNHVPSAIRLRKGKGHSILNYINLLQELLPPSTSTQYLRLMQITIVTGKNSLAPWYHFDGPGTWGRVSLLLGDFRPDSYYVQIYPLESLLRQSFGHGNTDSFFIDVAGVFQPSQMRHFTIKFEKIGLFKDSWLLDGIEFKLDGKIVYKETNLLAILDDKNSTFDGELDINNPRIESK
ncbi:hypothetical protein K7432_004023 [Basidiobolus ranarum]|uniref:Fungal lipase-type domain-containing protein n=1 Tax=Basidiobolus ranarum TaxID=34480 RepID=A0ABR2WZ06_9FUNG